VPYALQLLSHSLIRHDDFVEAIGDFAAHPRPGARQADGKVAVTHGLQADEDCAQVSF
jgi:hypothetical protein